MDFQEAAVMSSNIYYNFLKNNGRGLIEYGVSSIESDEKVFHLKTLNKIKIIDDIQIKIYNRTFTQEQIKPIEYNESDLILTVLPNPSFDGFDFLRRQSQMIYV